MQFRNLFISTIMLVAVAYGGTKAYMYYEAKQQIDSLLAPLRSYVDVEYESISTSIFGPVGVRGLRVGSADTGEQVIFGKVMLESFEKKKNEKVPRHLHITLDNVQISRAIHNTYSRNHKVPDLVDKLGYTSLYNMSKDLDALGYNDLMLDSYIEFFYDKDDGDVRIKFGEAINELGELDVLLNFAEVIPGMGSENIKTKIKEISLAYTDRSYVQRLIEKYAKENNKELESFRTELITQFEEELATHNLDLGDDAVREIKKFLTNPRKLTILIQPPDPISINSLKYYKPKDVPRLLNMQVYAE